MNTIIIYTRKTFLLFLALSTLNIYSMESQKNVDINETHEDRIEREMTKRCSALQDKFSKEECEKECVGDYLKQLHNCLVRQCTTQCMGRPFDEKWRYKTEKKELLIDLNATYEAYRFRETSTIDRCAEECLKKFNLVK